MDWRETVSAVHRVFRLPLPASPPSIPHSLFPIPISMPFAIELSETTVRYGTTTAIDGLSLAVRRGEVMALLGHNGAGKTTTVRVITGLVAAEQGRVRALGLDPLADGAALRRRLAVLGEASTLDERLTGRELLEVFAGLYDLPRAAATARIDVLLADVGLTERAHARVSTYSRGMRQRLSLARALLHEPELLLLDEPTAGLDPDATRRLHALVRRLRDVGRTVVLCTHNLPEAQDLADRVAVLARGKLLALGTPGELTRRLAPVTSLTIETAPTSIADAMAALGTLHGRSLTADGAGMLTVSGVSRDDVPALVARLAAAQVPLYRVVPRAPSLADAYFALQGEDVSSADDTSAMVPTP